MWYPTEAAFDPHRTGESLCSYSPFKLFHPEALYMYLYQPDRKKKNKQQVKLTQESPSPLFSVPFDDNEQ